MSFLKREIERESERERTRGSVASTRTSTLQLPTLISRSAMQHGMENGVSLMGGLRMMRSMFAVPEG